MTVMVPVALTSEEQIILQEQATEKGVSVDSLLCAAVVQIISS